jgi:hypothetical protein
MGLDSSLVIVFKRADFNAFRKVFAELVTSDSRNMVLSTEPDDGERPPLSIAFPLTSDSDGTVSQYIKEQKNVFTRVEDDKESLILSFSFFVGSGQKFSAFEITALTSSDSIFLSNSLPVRSRFAELLNSNSAKVAYYDNEGDEVRTILVGGKFGSSFPTPNIRKPESFKLLEQCYPDPF